MNTGVLGRRAVGGPVIVAYWGGMYIILMAVRRLYIEPRLDQKYPLSTSKRERRFAEKKQKSSGLKAKTENPE